ncbi:hemolysin D [Halarcobacter mediterraneus]|uniref:Hemolysin D n=1 Tax=Halarcobacter mediterraneus TaxID=2023153 RepID=A0A4V1M158_9BACT|nr:HlyD family type I secretion periplasmic adaptor subunit [Halarcobacter mediterraneus]RXK12296.1 hemolysin D [Halarcobacter mediterraneus]
MNDSLSMPSHDTSKVISFGLGVIIVVFVIFGGWMVLAPLAASSVAVGKVSADIDKKTVQHLEGGIVKNIYVKDGDSVKKGDLLIKLDDIQYNAELQILTSQYQDALGVHARTKALDEEKDKVVFPKELVNQNVIANQRNIFQTYRKRNLDEKAISKNKIIQLNNQIKGLSSLLKSKKQRLASISEEIVEWEELLKEKLVDKLKVRELKREKNSIEGDISNTISEIARLKEQIQEVKIEQLLREKNFKNENLETLVKAKSNIEDLKQKITTTKDRLRRTDVYSPIDGTVVGLNLHTQGAVIKPGSDILEVVPENTKLIVVAKVQTTDIDKVKVGLHADIRFSAFNLQIAHVVEGKVIHVSADSFVDEQSGNPYYEAKIEVTEKGKEQLQEYGFVLVSGMPAEVMINIGNRTAFSYFVKPFSDMLSRGFNEE